VHFPISLWVRTLQKLEGPCTKEGQRRLRLHPPNFDNIDSAQNCLLYASTLTTQGGYKHYGVHAPGCIDGSLCSTDPKMTRCPDNFMAEQSIEMRKTVEENYGHRKVQYMGMDEFLKCYECDTTEDSKQNRQKDGHKAQSREIALKASQIATNPSQ
jgi:hypothetical protein